MYFDINLRFIGLDSIHSVCYTMHTMRKGTKDAIIQLLKKREYSPRDIHRVLGVSLSLIHRYLKDLCADGFVERIGKAPRVSYRLVSEPDITVTSSIIDKHFIFKDFDGEVYHGVEAFLLWSRDNLKKYTLEEKVHLYEQYVRELQDLRKKDVVFSLEGKLDEFHEKTGEEVFLQDVVCAVPYAFPDFGKTKESILLSIAKEGSSQSREFADQLIGDFLPVLSSYIEKGGFDAIAFIPPSASRRVQLMQILRKRFLSIATVPVVDIEKQHGRVVQQQKHLSNIVRRLKNAEKTFYIVYAGKSYNKVLLVDDFVGSGATMNQIAKKLMRQGVAKKVWGIGIIGVRKGFTVVKKV